MMIDSKQLVQLFGTKSPFFRDFLERNRNKITHWDQTGDQSDNCQSSFNKWLKMFQHLHSSHSSEHLYELYLRHSYLSVILLIFLKKCITLKNEIKIKKNHLPSSELSECYDLLFSHNYFIWVIHDPIIPALEQEIETKTFAVEDLFHDLYQHLISIKDRLALGEFYTPPFLAKQMIKRVYQPGKVVIDPACGSGIFLIEILENILQKDHLDIPEKMKAMQNVYGCDVNPLAIATTRVNVALFLTLHRMQDLLPRLLTANIKLTDFLDDTSPFYSRMRKKVDLIIGNPPWLVLNNISNKTSKERLKKLAREFHILPPPHTISNLEISAIFLYQAKKLLKPGGFVFFIVSNGFIGGDNHVGTRQFNEFANVEVWKFTRDMFRIHNICLLAQHVPNLFRSKTELESLKVVVRKFHIKEKIGNMVASAAPFIMEEIGTEIYVPHTVEEVKNNGIQSYQVKKLVPLDAKKNLLPRGPSPYHPLCFNGAVISPRNLFFVTVEKIFIEKDEELVIIKPVIENAKQRWSFNPLEELQREHAIVEKKFIFHTIKSVDLIPFNVLRTRTVFLPLERDDKSGGYKLTTDHSSRGWHYFHQLDQLYQKHQKNDASLPSLWENINYQGKLTAARQRSPIKVIIQSGGTKVKAAIIKDSELIVDHACFFIGLTDIKEAYYLCGVLNAPCITKDVNIRQSEGARGSGRSIKKRPLEIAIPKFNNNDSHHVKIVQHAKKMESLIKSITNQFISQRKKPLKSAIKIQEHIYFTLKRKFRQLDELVLQLFIQ